jgi:membrane protein DedA with SNARE-associated domain/membrane-associated phospholipid phosphatase
MHIHEMMTRFTHWVHLHPHYGLHIAFLVAFVESIAIIGTIIPGAVTMTAIGSLIGAQILPFWISILWIIAGALCGDLLSFFAGYKYKNQLKNMWPLSRFPQIITKGEAFFKKHGGKSIMIGRFFGPVRSAIPLVAGILHMSPLRFACAAIPSAVLWAIAYTFPGVLIGALSSELPKGEATEFLVGILTAILIVWLCIWAIKLSLSSMLRFGNKIIDRLWNSLQKHHSTDKIIQLITKRDNPKDHMQLGIILLASICFIAAFTFAISVKYHGNLTAFNQPIFYALQSFRSNFVTEIFVLISFLGQKYSILACASALSIFLFMRGHKRAAMHNIAAIAFASVVVFLFKHYLYSPRPTGIAVPITNNSFPSGHATLSAVFFSLSAYWMTIQRRSWRQVVYPIFFTIIALVGISRLYLGAHWITDIAAGWLLAAGISLLIVASYRREAAENISKRYLFAFWVCVSLPFIAQTATMFHKNIHRYDLIWPAQKISFKTWWENPLEKTPLYRTNRLGQPSDPFNIQWAAPLQQIKQSLIDRGWYIFKPDVTLHSVLLRFGSLAPENHMPLLAPLFHNKPASVLFIKKISPRDLIECRLWPANLNFTNSHTPLWVGTINYHTAPTKTFAMRKDQRSRYEIDHSASRFAQDLGDWSWKQERIPLPSIPLSIAPDNWSGNILIVRQKEHN